MAKGFVKNYNKNALLIIKNNKNNNIDIDYEKLSFFPKEKEVLILPFCSFEVKKIELKKESYVYYIITLEYIEEKFENDKIVNLSIVGLKDD